MEKHTSELESDQIVNCSTEKQQAFAPLMLNLSDLFESVFTKIHQLFAIDCAAIILYDAPRISIQRAYLSEKNENGEISCLETVSNPIALSLLTTEIAEFQFPVLKSRQDWISDFGENHCLPNHTGDYHFHCYLPLEVNGKVIGTLELHNHKHELSEDGLTFCCTISDFLAGSLHNFQENSINVCGCSENIRVEHQQNRILQLSLLTKNAAKARNEEEFENILAAFFADNHAADLMAWGILDQQMETLYPKVTLMDIAEVQKINLTPKQLNNFKKKREKQLLYIPLEMPNQPAFILLTYESFTDHQTITAVFDSVFNIFLSQVINQFLLQTELNECKSTIENLTLNDKFLAEPITEIETVLHYPEIIGKSEQMNVVFNLLSKVSDSETTVLILGETGTGKELIAKAIHDASVRKEQIMIKINCAAIPPNLIESELFGHEKGSFTGATDKRIGKFELAHGGTIFLDEIGELPLDLQVKLLRVLQEKQIERVGGKTTIFTDVRIISATNRNLAEEVELGRFRRDLFYRLNVFPVFIPALRNRKTDIPALAAFFLRKFASKTNKQLEGFSKKVIGEMKIYNWPGNVRELEHLIERQVVLSTGPLITSIDIPKAEKNGFAERTTCNSVKTIDENERDHIFAVLEKCNGKISGPNGAAKLLGVPATTLNSKIKRLGLAKKHSY
ncbi:sigma 54-interacting transcriptional regulator [Pedobacter sp. AW1-32]|uniref:sigma 54-interacting transcriptional regulator n=1 Tax=Pedobacter sp. AW1-32 TaxID=3383026 RepID=UPI003FF0CDA7